MAYSRHYPAINWMSSYSSYVDKLRDYYESKLGEDVVDLRNQMLKLLYEEAKLKEIVMLVGEDVLPDDQRLILDISNVMKLGFLQQNAFSKVDTYVPLKKQVEMLKTIKLLYEEGHKAIKEQIPISQVKNADLYSKVIAMKNTISNEDLSGIKDLNDEIKEFYSDLISKYEK